ncbi:hypothetical protein BN971_00978 [Mycobacterium bohemicum DSM 44277]|uniref:Uncharacterized protein n=2 Tax=Mycobacterium bohemicum TaxID=56425 RepID=A0A1X1R1Q5_MYCBE|nr:MULTISPECIES: hypothetical protein [Mycobacterium]MCV6971405.1 hypothetical protein [Mycobacterium bohemicum]MCV7093300.1 hypothetical protein [Mycobacterium interjectum]ORU97844.1 hypothetical protein AWB93_16605 [Mycobacterium bohemicum]CPR07292.1 hypothetical protein BN971_00978 [Mycobacterium bohemicum DSM 44277]
MSFLPHILTTHEFWAGGFIVGALSSATTYISTRASDRRKAKQEDKVLDRKEEREDRLREHEALREAAMEFAQVSTDILTTTIDINGVFNMVRDAFYNQAGADDPNAEAKFEHSQKVIDAQMRIAVPVNKLKMFAPTNVLAAATRATAAIITTVQQTTEPFAGLVARKAASDEVNNFISVFREELGRDPYTNDQQQEQVASFLETLRKQVADFVEESKADMKAAGFKTTPWDAPRPKPEPEPEQTDEQPTFLGPTPSVPVKSLNVGEDIALPIARRGATGTIGLRSTIRSFNGDRTRMTVFVHNGAKTLTLNVNPELQFARVGAPPAAS